MEIKNTSAAIQYTSIVDQYATIGSVIDHSLTKKRSLIEIISNEEDNTTSTVNKTHRNKRVKTAAIIITSDEEKNKQRPRSDFTVLIDLTQDIHHCICGKIFDAGRKSRVGGDVSNDRSSLQRPLLTINIVEM